MSDTEFSRIKGYVNSCFAGWNHWYFKSSSSLDLHKIFTSNFCFQANKGYASVIMLVNLFFLSDTGENTKRMKGAAHE